MKVPTTLIDKATRLYDRSENISKRSPTGSEMARRKVPYSGGAFEGDGDPAR